MENRAFEMLILLQNSVGYLTGNIIADKLNVSDKTIRNIIRNINLQRDETGFSIDIKYGKGYRLSIIDKKKFDSFLISQQKEKIIPNSSKDRKQYLLEYLLTCKSYVKLDELSEALFISKKTLSSDLKKVEEILESYNLELNRKPNHGIKINGKEFDLRLCIANVIETVNPDFLKSNGNLEKDVRFEKISNIIKNNLGKHSYSIPSQMLYNLIVHLYVALIRIEKGKYIPMDDSKETIINQEEYNLANDIAHDVNNTFNVIFPKSEIIYIGIHLAGKQMTGRTQKCDTNVVILEDIANLVEKMLLRTDSAYQFELVNDLELRMNLCQHMVPLEVRIQHDMKMQNPLLADIKEKYFLSYTMAALACTVIEESYKKIVSEDEIGYIALAFALALERQRTKIVKKNILLVCASGNGSTQLLKYKYENEFKSYINKIETCDVFHVDKVDFNYIDYIFSTVPIYDRVPVPIQQVSFFLDDKGIAQVKNMLTFGNDEWLEKYYSKELFLSNISCDSKFEALKVMCEHVIEKQNLPEEFYNSVLEREKLSNTSFGNRVAMPHPCNVISENSFVCIGILERPVMWGSHEVQVVFLVSIGKNKGKSIQKFYQVTSRYLLNVFNIEELILQRNFELFYQVIRKIEI